MLELPIGEIVCGDCLEVMKGWPDKCVDAIVCDPPYGLSYDKDAKRKAGYQGPRQLGQRKDYGVSAWDDAPMNDGQIAEIHRVGQNQVVFGGNYVADRLPASSCWLVWDKDNGENDFADCELAWTSFKSATRIIKWRWQGMLQEPGFPKDLREHPTQKPLGVMRWIIEKYSKPGDLILDPFCGSGTTCVAAEQLGRRYIGIEISEDYCKIARRRVQEAKDQYALLEQRL
jgi:site-specific DNA-methyltransferase (adenine-specific)